MKNEAGFTLLNIAFLIPVIFSFAMLIAASYQLISKYTDVQRECRTHVLKAQQVLGKNLKELIDLNPEAKFLRTEEIALRAAILASSGAPPLIAVLEAKLNYNLIQQRILRSRQELLIYTGKFQAQRIMAELPMKVRSLRYSNVDLKIYKTPPYAIAQDHNTIPLFTEAQTIKANWRLPIGEFVPSVVLKIFSKTNYPSSIQGKCAATLVKKGGAWNPKLHLAKF